MSPAASYPGGAPLIAPEGRGLPELYRIGRMLARGASIDDALGDVAPVVQSLLAPRRVQIVYAASDQVRCVAWDHQGILARAERPASIGTLDLFEYFIHGAPRPSRSSYPPPSGPAGDNSLVLPLVVGRSPVFGLLEIVRRGPFGEDDLVFASALANDLAVAIERHGTVQSLRGSLQHGERLRSALELERAEAHSARWAAEWLTARYEGLVDGLGGSFLWIARSDTLSATYVSAGVEPILGYHRSELLAPGRLLHVIHADDRDGFESKLRGAIASRQPRRFVHRAVTVEGQSRWFLTGVQTGVQNSEVALYGFSADVTELQGEREHLEQKLEASETVTSVLGEAVLVIDRERIITFANPAAQSFLATTTPDLIGVPMSDVLSIREHGQPPPGDADEVVGSVLSEGRFYEGTQADFRRADGLAVPATFSASPIVVRSEITGCVLSFRNILQAQRAERDQRLLAQVTEALAEALDGGDVLGTLKRVTESVFADLCLIDERGRDPGHDPVRDAVLAAVTVAAVRQPLPFQQGGPLLVEDVRSTFAALAPLHAEVLRRAEVRSLIVVRLAASSARCARVVFATSGSGRRYGPEDVQIAKSLGERAATAVQNARLLEALQEAVRERQEILAVVSHDLRAPLTNVMLSARLLREPGESEIAALDIIERAVLQMDHMLKDLLDVSSIEAGQLSIAKSSVSLRALCDEACQGATLLAREQSIRFECCPPDADIALACDRDRILQVLANFLTNAFKFTPPSGKVTLTISLDAGDAWFEVTDTGPGLDEAARAKVFDRYWQEKAGRGRGLGLYIASGIVAAHRGQIGVRSRLGAGSTFYFRIPAQEEVAAPRLTKMLPPLESEPVSQRRA